MHHVCLVFISWENVLPGFKQSHEYWRDTDGENVKNIEAMTLPFTLLLLYRTDSAIYLLLEQALPLFAFQRNAPCSSNSAEMVGGAQW